MADLSHQQRWYLRNIEIAGQFVVDVGANVGELSQFFYDHGDEQTRVLSIEPVPANADRIAARIEAAADPARWRLERCAASSHTGEIELRMFFDPDHGWNSVAAGLARSTGLQPLVVPAKRLGALAPGANIVKVDVEGHEYEILDDALAALDSVHTWAIELHLVEHRPLESTLSAVSKLGFDLLAATQKPGDPSGNWYSARVPPTLTWAQLPVAKTRADGSVFKMLHLIARR